MRRWAIAAATGLMLLVKGAVAAQDPVLSTESAQVAGYGLWAPGPGAPVSVPEPGTLAGVGYQYPDGRWLDHGTTICASIGTHFAVGFRLADAVPEPFWAVRVVISHPLITRPDGKAASEETALAMLTHGEIREGWGFDRPYELVPGAWTMALWHGQTLIAKVTFDVRTDCPRVTA